MEITPNELQDIITLARKSRVKNVIDIIEHGKGAPQHSDGAEVPAYTVHPITDDASTELPILDTGKKKRKKSGGPAVTPSPSSAEDDPDKKDRGNRWRDRGLYNDGGKLIYYIVL